MCHFPLAVGLVTSVQVLSKTFCSDAAAGCPHLNLPLLFLPQTTAPDPERVMGIRLCILRLSDPFSPGEKSQLCPCCTAGEPQTTAFILSQLYKYLKTHEGEANIINILRVASKPESDLGLFGSVASAAVCTDTDLLGASGGASDVPASSFTIKPSFSVLQENRILSTDTHYM